MYKKKVKSIQSEAQTTASLGIMLYQNDGMDKENKSNAQDEKRGRAPKMKTRRADIVENIRETTL